MKLNKILWSRVFLWTKEKDKIQSLKQKLTQFTWNKLLYCICSDKENIWACYCSKTWIFWSFWASICYFIYALVVSWAAYAVFSDRPFIIFFLLVFWSKITILFKFFSKKNNHLWTTLSTLFFFIISVTFILPVNFVVSPNCSITFVSICWAFFKQSFFEYLLPFYVHFLQISVQEVVYFQRDLHLLDRTFCSCLVFDLYFFMRVVKWSLRLRPVTANFSKLFKLSAVFCHMANLPQLPDLISNIPMLAIPSFTIMSFSLFHDMIELWKGGKQKMSL